MPVQLQAQQLIHCSGHRCTLGQRQQEEEAHQKVLPIQGVEALVNGVIKVVMHQEEAPDQEEALGQEEQHRPRHPLHQEEEVREEDQEQIRCREELHPSRQEEDQEQIRCREELHPSRQEEEQEIQGLHHLHLQAFHNLHAHQIHGVHSIDPGKHCRS